MLKLAVTIVLIALPDCINPSLIGGEVFVATQPGARRGVVVFTLAAWSITFVFGLALALGLGDLILSLLPKPGASVKYALIIAAGVVMITGGAIIWIRRRALTSTAPIDQERTGRGSPVLLGAGLAGVELPTAFPYFAAIALIVGSRASDAGKLFLLILYCVVYTLPLIAIAVTVVVMGDRAERVLRPIGDRLVTHWPVIVGPMTTVIGIAILAVGIAGLSSM